MLKPSCGIREHNRLDGATRLVRRERKTQTFLRPSEPSVLETGILTWGYCPLRGRFGHEFELVE